MLVDKHIYTKDECVSLFSFLDSLEVEYHKPYKRFNQMVKVPRGQASVTLDDTIHYDYKVSGEGGHRRIQTQKTHSATGVRIHLRAIVPSEEEARLALRTMRSRRVTSNSDDEVDRWHHE